MGRQAHMILVVVICVLALAGGAAARAATDLHTQFVHLLAQIKAARQGGRPREALSKSLELATLLRHSAPADERVAMAYANLGERSEALRWLSDFAAMGQSDQALQSNPWFASFHASPRFTRILTAMRRNRMPVDRATSAVELRDARLLPEDIDYDSAARAYLLTSVLGRDIGRVGPGGTHNVFFRSPHGWPMLALKIDAQRGIVWATEVAIDGFASVPRKDWGRSALLCLRLKDGALIRRIDAARTSLGDMALMPNGDVIVSDGDNGGVYRARAGCTDASLQRVDSGQFLSPQTPAPLPDGTHVLVPDYARGIALLDVKTGATRWLDAGRTHAVHGIDGMYLISKGLLCVQNGTSPERVVLFRLNDKLKIISEKVIERSTATLGDPTHGVVVRGEFHYIANSGWSSLDDAGRLKPGARMTAARIRKVALADL